MKKKIIYSTAFTAMLTASAVFAGGPEIIPVQEDYFTGFYVGGFGAVHHATFDGDASLETTENLSLPGTFGFTSGTIPAGTILATSDGNGGSFDGYGGVQGGLNWTFGHRWVVGIVGFGEWGSQSSESEQTSTTPINVTGPGNFSFFSDPTNYLGSSTTVSSTVVKIENDYGVAGKIGYLFTPTTMLYAKIGAVWADISVSNNNNTSTNIVATDIDTTAADDSATFNSSLSGSASGEQTKTALLLGIGFEQFIYQDIISFDLEYDYANFGTVHADGDNSTLDTSSTVTNDGVTTPNSNSVTLPVSTEASGSVKVSTLLAGLNFYFGRNWL